MLIVQPKPKPRLLPRFLVERIVENIAYLNGFYPKNSECHRRNDPGNLGRTYKTPEEGYEVLRAGVRRALKLNLTFNSLCSDLMLGRKYANSDNEYAVKLCTRLGNHLNTLIDANTRLQDLAQGYELTTFVSRKS